MVEYSFGTLLNHDIIKQSAVSRTLVDECSLIVMIASHNNYEKLVTGAVHIDYLKLQ